MYEVKRDPCICNILLGKTGTIYFHIYGCPRHSATIEYDGLPWYKKLFRKDPRKSITQKL